MPELLRFQAHRVRNRFPTSYPLVRNFRLRWRMENEGYDTNPRKAVSSRKTIKSTRETETVQPGSEIAFMRRKCIIDRLSDIASRASDKEKADRRTPIAERRLHGCPSPLECRCRCRCRAS